MKAIQFSGVLLPSLCALAILAAGTIQEIKDPAKLGPPELSPSKAVTGAVGPFPAFCDGYGNPGASGLGYISVLTLQTGKASDDLDRILSGIVSYERAESSDAYIGQINMIIASSFTGPNGAVWGHDVAKADSIATGNVKPLFLQRARNGNDIPVYPVEPLLDAGKRLFGTREAKRFPILPGSHVVCAAKEYSASGPTTVWCAIGIAIAEDRAKDASLFIEDCGEFKPNKDGGTEKAYFDKILKNIAKCMMRCGDNQKAKYNKMFVGYKAQAIPEGFVGCALAAAPYVVLAKDAVPAKGARALLDMSITDWERERRLSPLTEKAK